MVQIIVGFSFGIILSQWSGSVLWFLVFVAFYYFVFGLIWRFQGPYWVWKDRAIIFLYTLLGWIIGHIAIGTDPFSLNSVSIQQSEIVYRRKQRVIESTEFTKEEKDIARGIKGKRAI